MHYSEGALLLEQLLTGSPEPTCKACWVPKVSEKGVIHADWPPAFSSPYFQHGLRHPLHFYISISG